MAEGGALARDAGDYRERAAGQALRDHFSCVWVNRLSTGAPASIVVIPDGTIDLQWISGQWRIAGPDSQPQTESLAAGAVVVGFRFQPGAASRWLGVAASELCDQRLPLQDILGSFGARMDAVAASAPHTATVDALEAVVSRWAASTPAPDLEMMRVYRLLSDGAPVGSHVVPWMMRELSMSERTLRRRFEAAFGYGPKTLDRILRFQRFLDLSRRDATRPTVSSTARRAAAAGYADHAHLVRECRRLTLRTPSEIV